MEKRMSIGRVLAWCGLVTAAGFTVPAHAADGPRAPKAGVRPIFRCSFAVSLQGSANDMAVNPNDDELMVLDVVDQDHQYLLITDSNCHPKRVISADALGVNRLSAITYDEKTSQLIVSDTGASEVVWIDYATLARTSACEPRQFEPGYGLDDFSALGWLALDDTVSGNTSVIWLLDGRCELVGARPSYPLGPGWTPFGQTSASFYPQLGGFLYFSAQDADVAGTSFDGVIQSIGALGNIGYADVIAQPGAGSLLALTSDGALYDVLDLSLTQPTSLAGTFLSDAGWLVVLFDRGQGAFNGIVRFPSGDEHVFGTFHGDSRAVSFGVRLPTGNAVVLAGTANADLTEIVLPAPFGTLHRSFDIL